MFETSVFRYLVPAESIQYLAWILEGYEGIAVLETIDPVTGEIMIYGPAELESSVREIVRAVAAELDRGEIVELSHTVVIEGEDSIDNENRTEDGSG